MFDRNATTSFGLISGFLLISQLTLFWFSGWHFDHHIIERKAEKTKILEEMTPLW